MIVEVKQEHIDEGVRGCPCYCAVSLAVREALKDKYEFSNERFLGVSDAVKEEISIGESWVETAVCGSGAEISIFTKHFNNTKEEIEIVEDYIAIKDLMSSGGINDLMLEVWIENFDCFDVEPTSFVIEDIHRMNK